MNQRGLTLLELLLVLMILSSLALASANFLGNADGQARFEETNRKLKSLRTAIIGAPFDPEVNNLFGFVVDMGLLPASIDELINGQNHFPEVSSGFPVPIFDPLPDPDTGFNDGGTPEEVELNHDDELLVKGYRGGYLLTGPGFTGADAEFRDGFGNRTAVPDDGNFGWLFVPKPPAGPTSLTMGSSGDLEGDYSAGVSLGIASHHFLVDSNMLNVEVVNRGTKIVAKSGTLYLVLIVYKGGSTHRWLQIRSQDSSLSQIEADSSPIFRIEIPTHAQSVPMGEHLLVLVYADSPDREAYEKFDDMTGAPGNRNGESTRRYTQRITLRPGPHPATTIRMLLN